MKPDELLKNLTEAEVKKDATILTGYAQKGSGGDIKFSLSCVDWISIPSELIEEGEIIGQSHCRDHSHPIVRLVLKAGHTEVEKTLHQLLRALASSGAFHANERIAREASTGQQTRSQGRVFRTVPEHELVKSRQDPRRFF